MQYSYRLEFVIAGKRRSLLIEEGGNIVRPGWPGEDYYLPSVQAAWDAISALPTVSQMLSPRPGTLGNAARQEFIENRG